MRLGFEVRAADIEPSEPLVQLITSNITEVARIEAPGIPAGSPTTPTASFS